MKWLQYLRLKAYTILEFLFVCSPQLLTQFQTNRPFGTVLENSFLD